MSSRSRKSLRVATRHSGAEGRRVSVPSSTELDPNAETDTDLKPLDPDAPVKLEILAGDSREVRQMVEFLVRRERKVDEKQTWRSGVWLEKEIDKWFVDKVVGFGNVQTGDIVFLYASVCRS